MMRKLVLAAVAAATVTATIAPGVAGAAVRAATTVTIQVEGTDFWGYVSSPAPRKCAKDRKVVLFKQVGSVQDPRVDTKVASDTTSKVGDRWRWETGNTGMYGKFYARAPKTPNCKADSSPTVRAVRP